MYFDWLIDWLTDWLTDKLAVRMSVCVIGHSKRRLLRSHETPAPACDLGQPAWWRHDTVWPSDLLCARHGRSAWANISSCRHTQRRWGLTPAQSLTTFFEDFPFKTILYLLTLGLITKKSWLNFVELSSNEHCYVLWITVYICLGTWRVSEEHSDDWNLEGIVLLFLFLLFLLLYIYYYYYFYNALKCKETKG